MLAYRFDEETKEYLGTQEAQQDPLDGGWLLPANCTFVEPQLIPSLEQVLIYTPANDSWKLETDHRGGLQVKLDDITFSEVDYIGDAQEGYQFITQEVFENYIADNDRYKVIDGVFTDIIDTPEYEEIKRQKEIERVKHLTCTKRVLALALQQLGVSYAQLKELIAENEQAQLEWDLCVMLERQNPLIDTMATQLGFTSEQVDTIFKQANGEID